MDQEYAHAQAKYAASNAGSGSILGSASLGGTANQIRAPSELETIIKRLDGLHSHACDIASHASSVADRILGSVPEGNEAHEGEKPDSMLGRVHEAIGSIECALSRASASLGRLNRL